MKIETADGLFLPAGFWRRIVPRLVVNYAGVIGIGLYSVNGDLDAKNIAIVLVLTSAVPISQFVRYKIAGHKHSQLKELYGQRYVALVESGEIPVTPEGIFYLLAPGRQAEKLLQSAAEEGSDKPAPGLEVGGADK